MELKMISYNVERSVHLRSLTLPVPGFGLNMKLRKDKRSLFWSFSHDDGKARNAVIARVNHKSTDFLTRALCGSFVVFSDESL
jgi:hypothetical protein